MVWVESEEPADISVGLELARVRSSHSEDNLRVIPRLVVWGRKVAEEGLMMVKEIVEECRVGKWKVCYRQALSEDHT